MKCVYESAQKVCIRISTRNVYISHVLGLRLFSLGLCSTLVQVQCLLGLSLKSLLLLHLLAVLADVGDEHVDNGKEHKLHAVFVRTR